MTDKEEKEDDVSDECDRPGQHLWPNQAKWLHELILDARRVEHNVDALGDLYKSGGQAYDEKLNAVTAQLARAVIQRLAAGVDGVQIDGEGSVLPQEALEAQLAYLEAKLGKLAHEMDTRVGAIERKFSLFSWSGS